MSPEEVPPPPYSGNPNLNGNTDRSPATASTVNSSNPPEFDGKRPMNFLYISRGTSGIKDTFVIDPYLHIPRTLLDREVQHLPEGDLQNLSLTTKNLGQIHVDVCLVSSQATRNDRSASALTRARKKKAKINVASDGGNVRVKVKSTQTSSRPAFDLKIDTTPRTASQHGRVQETTDSGSVYLFLPRSFSGPLMIQSSSRITLSKSFNKSPFLHTLFDSENDPRFSSVKRYFLGRVSLWDWQDTNSVWDEVHVKASGKVTVLFEDEGTYELIMSEWGLSLGRVCASLVFFAVLLKWCL